MSEDARGFLRRYAPMIYGPSALFAVGEGAVIPIVPLIAIELGASVAAAALIAGALIIGRLLGNLPAGWVVARFGERITMAGSGTLAFVGVIGMALAPSQFVLALAVFWVGVSSAAFSIARHAFMTTRVPFAFRARSLSLLGGVYRFGIFLGPFIGSAAVAFTGDNRSVCWIFVGCLTAAVLLVWFGPDPERLAETPPVSATSTIPIRVGAMRTIGEHAEVLARVGTAAACMSAVRSAQRVVLPLWGESLGLDTSTILLVVGFSGAIDFALFYLSGQVMDRYGRLWAALPALSIMGVGFVVLSLTHEVTSAVAWYIACSLVVGLGNGLSSGILMTIGADLAPRHDPAPFLGAWHTITDGGSAATPIIFSAVVAVSSISLATGLIGAIATVGVWGFARWVPRYVKRPER